MIKQKRQTEKQGKRTKRNISLLLCICVLTGALLSFAGILPQNLRMSVGGKSEEVKWVDFDVTYDVLKAAMELDIKSYEEEVPISWVDTLSYLASRYGGEFSRYKQSDMSDFAEKLQGGADLTDLTNDLPYFPYYQKAYGAALSGFLGEFKRQVPSGEDGSVIWEEKYGLKAFSPIAEGYWYTDYDDFGAGRSYGYNRKHFGHDLMVETGTPVIAIESGRVEALGWNQYGGWRIGIRSFDGQRYYYYAHLRKDHPYNDKIAEGTVVSAGDVIGYSGRTGYSVKENVNNIDTPHLHVGLQLIFNEEEKDSPNQIWIDLYALTRLLSQNKSQVYKEEEKKEYYRSYLFSEPSYYQEEQLLEDTRELQQQNEILLNIITSDSAQKETSASVPEAENSQTGLFDRTADVPILMYHGLIRDPKEQTKYFINPDYFESDLIYLKEHGYTTIFMSELINYVEKGGDLPKKPIILTFDDGYYNNYYYAYPLLRQYDSKAVISIIGKFTDDFSLLRENNVIYSHITWPQINEMINSGHVEIQNHTYNLHTYDKGRKGAKQKNGESDADYKTFLEGDVGLLQTKIKEATGIAPTTFTYPFGFMSDCSDAVLKDMGFKATLSCTEGINYIKRDPDDLFKLKRYLRPPGKSSEDFFKGLGL